MTRQTKMLLRELAPSLYGFARDVAGGFALLFAIVTWVCVFSII